MTLPSFRREKSLIKQGYRLVAGVDEAGRGPLAGPVVAAAVILSVKIKGLNDSKLLGPSAREGLFQAIKKEAVAIGIGIVSHKTIDRINIHQAVLLAMRKAVLSLEFYPDHLLVDGKFGLDLDLPQTTIISGDRLSCSIAAASIIAKVTRDRMMRRYHTKYPDYGFDRHMGYGTKTHFERISRHGISPIHRRTFFA